jgi:hypothetical protein
MREGAGPGEEDEERGCEDRGAVAQREADEAVERSGRCGLRGRADRHGESPFLRRLSEARRTRRKALVAAKKTAWEFHGDGAAVVAAAEALAAAICSFVISLPSSL